MARYVKQAHGGTLRILEKGDVGNPKGPPKRLETILKNEGYTRGQVYQMYQQIGAITEAEAVAITKDDKATMFEKTLAQSVINSRKKGDLRTMETIIDRGYGKVKDEMSISLLEEKPKITSIKERTLDPVEASRLYQELMK